MVRHDSVGKKLEEYREIKPYWIKQIMKWLNSGERNGIRKWVSVHYSGGFYEDLQRLFELVKKYESELKTG